MNFKMSLVISYIWSIPATATIAILSVWLPDSVPWPFTCAIYFSTFSDFYVFSGLPALDVTITWNSQIINIWDETMVSQVTKVYASQLTQNRFCQLRTVLLTWILFSYSWSCFPYSYFSFLWFIVCHCIHFLILAWLVTFFQLCFNHRT